MASFAVRSLPFVRSIRHFSQTRRISNSRSSFAPFLVSRSSSGTNSSAASCVVCGARWSFTTTREFSRVARKGLGRRSVSDGALAVAEEEEEEDDEEVDEDAREREPRSKNQRKRDSSRARHWGVELASCTPAQIKQAVRWAGLSDDVYDAVILAKNLGTSSRVRNGRRRQLNYLGGLLRDVDPDVMEPVLKAAKNGDTEGIMFSRPTSTESTEEEDFSADDAEEAEESGEQNGINLVAERWLEGMLASDSVTEDEIYSIFYVEFDRQELRKLVRTAQKSSGGGDGEGDGSRKSLSKLRSFLVNIARQHVENQAMYS